MTRQVTIILLALIALYGLIEAWPLLRGPSLEVFVPGDNASVEGGIVDIRGRVSHVSVLTLNGTPVLYDQEGSFSTTLAFPRGGSILSFVARDRFGRTVTITRSLFVP